MSLINEYMYMRNPTDIRLCISHLLLHDVYFIKKRLLS